MILPIRTDSPLRSTPWMNWVLITLNVLVFLAQVRFGERLYGPFVLYTDEPTLHAYFSYAILHGGWMHLIGNMLFLYIFGNNVNDKMGNLGYLAFYLAGGVFAGITFVVLQPPQETAAVVGASGAVAAVTGAYLVLFPRSTVTVLFFFIIIGFWHIPSMYFIIFFFLKDIIMNFGGPTGVAHTAHIGGTVFGFTVCMSMLAARLLPRDQFDVLALLQRWNKRRQYQSMVRRGYDPFGYSPSLRTEPQQREPADPKLEKIQDLRAEISESIAHHNLPHAAILFLELKKIDPQQVLSRQAQLDVANQLASQQFYEQAADAYEQYLRHYPNSDQVGHVGLMLGLIYARYLQQPERGRQHLETALQRLHTEREIQMARAELAQIAAGASAGSGSPHEPQKP